MNGIAFFFVITLTASWCLAIFAHSGGNCSFFKNMAIADCSYRGFHVVPPDLPTSLQSLDLSGNHIHVLKNMSFISLRQLKNLTLDGNNMTNFESAAFEGLGSLRFLSLSENNLAYDNRTFHENIFKPLSSLEILHSSCNNCTKINTTQHYPDLAFRYLSNVSYLKIDLCPHPYFGRGFENLTNLKTLEFQWCSLNQLQNDTLAVFKHSITELRIPGCPAVNTVVGIGAFEGMTRLSSLDLSNSQFSLPSALSLLYGLQNNSMEMVNLYHVNSIHFLRIGEPYAVILNKNMTKYLNKMCIKNFNIGNNGIVEYEKDSLFNFQRPYCIETMYFSENKFVTLSGWAKNQLFKILIQARRLREINYSYMPFELRNTWEMRDPPRHMDTATFYCPINFTSINVSHLVADVHLNLNATFVGCHNLTKIDLSYTTFESLYFEFRGLNNVKYVDVSGLDFTRSWPATLKSFPNVETLIIRSANLDRALQNSNTKNVFIHNNNIRNLDISGNHLLHISPEILNGMPLISHINASGNSLATFPVLLLSKPYLQTIDLSGNRITRLNSTVLSWLDKHAQLSEVKLFLRGNLFSCTCKDVNFIRWLKSTRVWLDNDGVYKCFFANGTVSNTSWVIQHFSTIFDNCNSPFWLVFSVTSSTILSVVLISSILIYRFRWRITYLYFLYCRRNKDAEPIMSFEYDAFVGYHANDYGWVCYDLRKKLEEEMGFKLCLHDRDFELGETIFNNIENKISESRNIIFVISPSSDTADWFTFEIEMAKKDMIQRRCNNIILIIKEETSPHLMPAIVKEIWDNVTCLIWPQNDTSCEATDTFWNRLRDAM